MGYGVINNYMECAPCQPEHCLSCKGSAARCIYCSLGYGVTSGALCANCTDSNCRNCSSNI